MGYFSEFFKEMYSGYQDRFKSIEEVESIKLAVLAEMNDIPKELIKEILENLDQKIIEMRFNKVVKKVQDKDRKKKVISEKEKLEKEINKISKKLSDIENNIIE